MAREPRILIIEDDPDQVLMYQVEFEAHGFTVDTSLTGDDGIAKAKSNKPDAILLDVLMEGKNGLEVTRELRKSPRTKSIPIVVFTNYGEEEFAAEARKLGAAKFIIKTARVPREIVREIRALIGAPPEKDRKRSHRPENILLIEDNPYHRQMYATKFERGGFLLTTAINGEEGLKRAQEGNIDVILLDLALPDISGTEVLRRLKADARTRDIPVVTFTVTPKQELPAEVRRYAEENSVAYYEKMTRMPSEAVELVEKVLRERRRPEG